MRSNHPGSALNEEWELLDPIGGKQVRLRFHGPFEGREVLWNATFVALEHGPNYIDIGEAEGDAMPLTVGLAVGCFDAAAIRNAVLMIRRYKRLHPGHHRYGAEYAREP